MGELMDKVRGKIKEATGKISGRRDLEREGKVDQVRGKAKEEFEDAKRAVRESTESPHPPRT